MTVRRLEEGKGGGQREARRGGREGTANYRGRLVTWRQILDGPRGQRSATAGPVNTSTRLVGT